MNNGEMRDSSKPPSKKNKEFIRNNLTNHKEVVVIKDTDSNKAETIDFTAGHSIMLTRRRCESADALTPHGDEQYKFSEAIQSGFPVHNDPNVGVYKLSSFKDELKKAKGCNNFFLLIPKNFDNKVEELPPKSGIMFGDQLLSFILLQGDGINN